MDIERLSLYEDSALEQSPGPAGEAELPPVRYQLVRTEGELRAATERLRASTTLAVDTETTGLDPLSDTLRLVQLAAAGNPHVVFLVDMSGVEAGGREPLRALLAGPAVKVFQNAKFDLKFLHRAGLPVGGRLFDCMLASQLLDSGQWSPGHSLAALARRYLGIELPKEMQVSDWGGILSAEQLEYAARDADILLLLRKRLVPLLRAAGLVEAAKLEFDCVRAVVAMELNGIRIDLALLEELTKGLLVRQDEAALRLRLELRKASTQSQLFEDTASINLDSQTQLLEALRSAGIPVSRTARWELGPLAQQYPAVDALLEYRKVSKAVQAFSNSIPKYVHPSTGRVHPQYRQMGASTGRFSCGNPNLQQIPRDRAFRSCFVPAPGNKLVVADYSQIELRVVAEISRDSTMLRAYAHGEDLHRLTASLVAAKPQSEVTKDERQAAKAVNFGLIYAMGARGLQGYAKTTYGVEMSLEEAQTFRDRFFAAYRGVGEWHQRIRRAPPSESRTLCGRRRLWAGEARLTTLYNTPVQGTAADILKKALALLPDALRGTGALLVGNVHDEILIEAPAEQAQGVARILSATMRLAGEAYLTLVTAEAEATVVDNWAQK